MGVDGGDYDDGDDNAIMVMVNDKSFIESFSVITLKDCLPICFCLPAPSIAIFFLEITVQGKRV